MSSVNFSGSISSSKDFDILSLVCLDQLGRLGGLICVMTKEDWESEFSGAARLFALRRGIFYWEFKHGMRGKEEDGEHWTLNTHLPCGFLSMFRYIKIFSMIHICAI